MFGNCVLMTLKSYWSPSSEHCRNSSMYINICALDLNYCFLTFACP
uniref:Uncharacterized protein n=1 Tax=Rhizophora mucronata TaxID=61149 RepID=A0A2P2P891_RHIMU